MKNLKQLDDTALRINGIEALNKALGATGAWRFLTMISQEPTDYVSISRRLYKGRTVDEIYDRARIIWKAKFRRKLFPVTGCDPDHA